MDDEDIDAWFKRIEASTPPETPGGVLNAVEGLEPRLAELAPLETLAILAGLQTDPVFGANLVRLDMAMRLVRLCADGTKRPTRDKLFRLLNRDLVDCGVSRLEDPPEDFFVVTLATKRGAFHLFQGIWEKAGALPKT